MQNLIFHPSEKCDFEYFFEKNAVFFQSVGHNSPFTTGHNKPGHNKPVTTGHNKPRHNKPRHN